MPTVSTTGKRGKIDPVKAYQLRVNHRLSYQDIADHFGVEKSSVIQRLQRFSSLLQNQEDKTAFENIRTQALTTIEEQLMASLSDPDKLAKASLNNVAYAFQQIHTARRLEEEKSTANSSAVLHVLIEQQHSLLFRRQKPLDTPITPSEVSPEDVSTPAPTPLP
jgi:predicted DNA-binding protein YlxM (UPF0122 family)